MGTRLYVKNLQNKITKESISKFFSSVGKLTDCQLFPERGFGFIGFGTEKESSKALALSGTVLGKNRIQISVALNLKDDQTTKKVIDQKQKKNKKQSSENVNQSIDSEKTTLKEKNTLTEDNSSDEELFKKKEAPPVLDDFLRSKVDPTLIEEEESEEENESSGSEDTDQDQTTESKSKKKKKKKTKKSAPGGFAVKIKGLAQSVKIKEIKDFFKPIPVKNVQIQKNGHGVVYFSLESEQKDAIRRNRSFIGKKKVNIKAFEVPSLPPNDPAPAPDKGKARREMKEFPSKPDEDVVEEIRDTGRLFLRNLSFQCSEDDILKLVQPFGKLTEVYVAYDGLLKQSKGFGFVSFMFPDDAIKAFRALDQTSFQGRNLHILPGKSKPDDVTTGTPGGTSSFKATKQAALKASAGSSHNWNTLFISPDVVASITASQQAVDKSKLLNTKDKDGAAVRLALGETQIVLETRNFLQEHGVQLDALDKDNDASQVTNPALVTNQRRLKMSQKSLVAASATSNLSLTTFLVKNLPVPLWGEAVETEQELTQRLTKFDGFKRLILPPYGVTGIVQFSVPQQAKAAFKALAYSKFKDRMLLVQWAPQGLVEESESKKDETIDTPAPDIPTKEDKKKDKKSRKRKLDESKTESAPSMDDIAPVSPQDPPPVAKQPKLPSPVKAEKSVGEMKPHHVLLVRNVAFQANQRELEALFSPFGQLTAVRLPLKASGSHRGFAFIEFIHAEEAKKALDTLRLSTHLYGRRLVIEFADISSKNSSESRQILTQGGDADKIIMKSS